MVIFSILIMSTGASIIGAAIGGVVNAGIKGTQFLWRKATKSDEEHTSA